jgi:hypothetical protein
MHLVPAVLSFCAILAALRATKNAIGYCKRLLLCRVNNQPRSPMRAYTFKEKTQITAGAVAALVIVGWLLVLAIAFLAVR